MAAYLTSIDLHSAAETNAAFGISNLENVPVLHELMPDGACHMSWRFLHGDVNNNKELHVEFAIQSVHETNSILSFDVYALPYFSHGLVHEKVTRGMGKNFSVPSDMHRHTVSALREEFEAGRPLELVDRLRSAQEWAFLEKLRECVDFLPNSSQELAFRRLHDAVGEELKDPCFNEYVVDRPIVLHPGMKDHIFFKDARSLTDSGHICPIDLDAH